MQSVGAAEVEVDLANYMIVTAASAQPQTLAAVANNVSAATLASRVNNLAGTVTRYSSAVSVGP